MMRLHLLYAITGANIGKLNRPIMYNVGLLEEVSDDEKNLCDVLNSIRR